MSKIKIRIINVKFINEKMSVESIVKDCEFKDGDYHVNINKSFNTVSSSVARDEIVFMPICKKGYCMITVCSFNISDEYESILKKKIFEIAILYLNSEIENYESIIKDSEGRINNLQAYIKEMKKNID